MKKNIYISTAIYPCKPAMILNNALTKYFSKNNQHIVSNPSSADYIFINTCGVTEPCENYSFDKIHKFLKLKKNNSKIVIFGCLPKINYNRLCEIEEKNIIILKEITQVDDLFDFQHLYNSIPRQIDRGTINQLDLKIPNEFLLLKNKFFRNALKKINLKYLKYLLDASLVKNRHLIEIAEGCTDRCSFCAIKNVKGSIHSHSINKIMENIKNLGIQKADLLSLVAQDCGAYGYDRNENLFSLLSCINTKYPGVCFEITTLNPKWLISQKKMWLEIFANFNIKEVTIPLQSGSQRIICLMNRRYDLEDVYSVLQMLKKISPKTYFRSHVICGFPNENIFDYFKSYKIVNIFDNTQILSYDDRPETASDKLTGKNSKCSIILKTTFISAYSLINSFLKILIKK